MLDKIINFIIENIQTIILLYGIGAAIAFIVVILFFFSVCEEEKKERELHPDDYLYQQDIPKLSDTMCIGGVIAIGCAILWWAIPLIIAGAYLICVVEKKFPSMMGKIKDDDEEETEE